ncbi:MAG: VWA domain-containing protein [Pyrinomonadaceae bacterium]|nr:VWA domain-containing protein [Pyrinomonadaceae bacterium]
MREVRVEKSSGGRRVLALIVFCALMFVLLAVSNAGSAQTQEARPRRASQEQGKSTTPTPTPVVVKPTPTPAAPAAGAPALRPSPTPDDEGEEIGEGDIVKVDANLVNLNVRVIDRNNRPIDNVRKEEFRVYEDGVLQPIEFFTREEVPISYGLAVDTSGSLRPLLQQVIDAAKTVINSNKPGDETFLVRFIDSDKIETVQDFTSNKADLLDAIDSFYVEGGQTAIIDAVYLSAEHVAQYKKGDDNDRRRRALIVITDGEDRGSFYKKEQLFAKLREEDVQIYVIGFVNELDREGGFIRKSPREEAMNLLNRFAKETGGRVFYPESLSELPKIAEEIVRDMRTQYVVSYNPTNKARDGSFRSIRVTVADAPGSGKRIALTRSGRTVPREGTQPAQPKQPAATTLKPSPPGSRKSP